MLKNGVIEESSSPYAFNIVVVGKKDRAGEGMDRLCINYAPLNKITISDRYPLPNINETCSRFWKSKWFTSLDLALAYWQVLVRKKDREKTAFKIRSGQYQFRVMPFRLCNASATFQRLMNKILRPYVGKFVEVYLDDVIIHSRTKEEHIKHVRAVLQKVREANLKLKPSKCKWFKQELTFVGHVIGINGIRPDPKNIEKLTSKPIRAHPNFDKSFKLYTDASDTGLGAVLAQDDEEGKERVIAYEARRLNSAERVYPTTEKECLAVVWAIQKFKQYLGGWIPFTVFTDHAALKTLMKHDHPSPRRARWMEILSSYHFDIQHKPGKKMGHADYLSRMNSTQTEFPWNRKDAKYVLNVLYNDKGVYGSERYKDL